MTLNGWLYAGRVLLTIFGLVGALIVVPTTRAPRVAGMLLSTFAVAFLWALIGALAPTSIWPVHSFERPTISVLWGLSFHWLNGVILGLFGGGLFLVVETASALFSDGATWIQGASISLTALALTLFSILALGFAGVLWTVLFLVAQRLVGQAFPDLKNTAATVAVEILVTVGIGLILGVVVRTLTGFGESTRNFTTRKPQLVGFILTALCISAGFIPN